MSRYDSDGNLCVSVQAGTTGTGGAGLTQTEHDALLAVATAVAQATQITHEAAIRAAVEALAAALVSGRLRVDPSGVVSPISAMALPLPAGATTEATLQAVRDRLPAALAAGRLPVESVSQAQTQYEFSIAGLAPGATALSPVIDLGASRPSLQIQAEKLNGANQADTLQVVQSADALAMTAPAPVMRGDAIGNAAAFSNTSGQQCCVYGRPSRRSIQVQFTCASGGVAQPAGAVMTLTLNWGR